MRGIDLKHIILIAIISLGLTGVNAQSTEDSEFSGSSVGKALQKLRWDMNLGTAFTYIPGYGGGMSYYASPGFSYPLGKNFSFHGGITAGVYTMPGFGSGENGMQKIQSGFASIYGTGAYHLNERVVFYATGVKSIHSFGNMNPVFSPSFNEISVGSSIKLGENVTIGASVHFREYNSPMNPASSPFYY